MSLSGNREKNGLDNAVEAELWDDARDNVEVLNSKYGPDLTSVNGITKAVVSDITYPIPGAELRKEEEAKDQESSDLPTVSSSAADDQSKHSTNTITTTTTTTEDKVIDLTLHEAVFNNDANRIYEILKDDVNYAKNLINSKDKHGNTPLHLACMLGRSKEIVQALLQCGASVECKNLNRWTPFQEACSYGNRDIITLVTKKLDEDVRETFNREKLKIREHLEKTPNYRLVLKWQFQTWVPFVTQMLPNDTTVINKQGKYFRIDTRLLDYGDMFSSSVKKEFSCLIYSDKFEKKWMIINHGEKQYQHVETQTNKDIETKVDEIMSFDIMDLEMKSTDAQLTRTTSGWIWRADKIEQVGRYKASLYSFNNVFLITRKRREHLKQNDLKRNKFAYKSAVNAFKFGLKPSMKDFEKANQAYDSSDEINGEENWEDADDSEGHHRASLTPPPASNVTWTQYCQSEPGQFPSLGREQKCKVAKTAFKAKIAMTDEFPITKNEFLDLLSIVPLKMFKKLKDFIEMKLPDGFPVRFEVPIFPFLTALITFEDFTFLDDNIDESLFSLPPDYKENPSLVPLFNQKLKGSNNS